MLWSDTIDNLSSYKVESPAFHTMRYSSDHTMQVGFSFDMTMAADRMWTHIEQLVSCPENISLSTPGRCQGFLSYKTDLCARTNTDFSPLIINIQS